MAYIPTEWHDGDLITAERMNKLEKGVENEQVGPPGPQGPKGGTGPAGPQGEPGKDGVDGFSPTVEVSDIDGGHRVTITDADGPKTFWVMDGKGGEGGGSGGSGESAGFGEVTATIDGTTGTPSVKVTTDGPDTAKEFHFAFSGLKGDPGATGPQGPKGDKGDTGPQGATGPQGPAGNDGITSFNGRTGAVKPETGDYTAAQVGAVPTTLTVNSKPLSSNITLSASDVNARPSTWTPSASDVGAVPTSRTVNGKPLSSDIKLSASDIGAQDAGSYAPTSNPVFTGSISLSRDSKSEKGENSLAIGYEVKASNSYACAVGYRVEASGHSSCAEGYETVASGSQSHAECRKTKASGNYSHSSGYYTTAEYYASTALGRYNVEYDPSANANNIGYYLVIGKGTGDSSRSNAFRVTSTATYAAGSINGTGADYAEMFEWEDGNPNAEDRIGRFVTLDGTKIRLAKSADEFILGIISGAPTIVGDVHDDQWHDMYVRDVFGRSVWEDIEVPEERGLDGSVIIPAHTEHREKVNPNYRNEERYIARSDRPEWGVVGMLGKLVAIDDGTCQINGWCTPGPGGIATHSDERTKFRVMERIDETHVRVLIIF